MTDEELRFLVDAKWPLPRARDLNALSWDVFISAFNDTDRVQKTFDIVPAHRKFWWLLPEYNYDPTDRVPAGAFEPPGTSEAEVVDSGLANIGVAVGCGRVCIDVTGFFPQHILYLLRRLPLLGIPSFHMMYTEPESYARGAETVFSMGDVEVVRQVAGFEGQHTTEMGNDVLIVGVGYDHNLIGRTILEKESARLIQLQCLPSLSADMYNESILRLDNLSLSPSERIDEHLFFATANDPFVTAAVLCSAIASIRKRQTISNLYLSPLATKPQVLGFGLYYLRDCIGTPASIIYPFSSRHSRGSSKGVGRTWVYPVDLS